MTILLVILHVTVSIFLIGVVLLQAGKGAEIGASFGSASSHTIFGSRGPGSFLGKLTTGAAIIFMITSFSLAFIGKKGVGPSSVIPRQMETPPIESVQPAPVPEPSLPAEPPVPAEPSEK